MKKTLYAYYPHPYFASISISGRYCELQCKHCNAKYLNRMLPASTPKEFIQLCKKLDEKGGKGILVSGGFDKEGGLSNLPIFLSAVEKVKKETALKINVHTGFVDEKLAHQLSGRIDVASVDVVGDEHTSREVYGLDVSKDDYASTLKNLEHANIPVAPHICIGLHASRLRHEVPALQLIKSNANPSVVVLIIFTPTKGTDYQLMPPPRCKDITFVMREARQHFPLTPIALGCMRPRNRERELIEKKALLAGINRIVLPTKNTIKFAQDHEYEVQRVGGCCALPYEPE